MKKHFILAAMAISALFTACSNDDDSTPLNEGQVPVSFTIGGIDSRATTNATDFTTSFDNGDAIGISGTNVTPAMSNVKYNVTVANSSATIAPEDDGEFNYGDADAIFNAYYPYADDFSGTFAVQTNQVEGISTSDFLTATAQGSATTPNVTLEFSHRLVLVQVKLTGVTNVNSVILKNAKTKVTYTASTSSTAESTVALAETENEATDIVMYPQTANTTYWAIIPAQEIAAGNLIEVNATEGTFIYTTQANSTFTESSLVKYSLTVKETVEEAKLVEYAPVTIKAWTGTDSEEISGDLEEKKFHLPIEIASITSGGMVPNTTNTITAGWRYNNGTGNVETTEEDGTFIKYVAPTSLGSNWYNDGVSYYCTENLNPTSKYRVTFKIKGSNTSNSLHVYVAVNSGGNKIFQVSEYNGNETEAYSVAPYTTPTDFTEKTFVINPAKSQTGLYTAANSWNDNTSPVPFAICFKPTTASTEATEGTDGAEGTEATETIYYIKDVTITEL